MEELGVERGRELIAMGNGTIRRQMELEGKYTREIEELEGKWRLRASGQGHGGFGREMRLEGKLTGTWRSSQEVNGSGE